MGDILVLTLAGLVIIGAAAGISVALDRLRGPVRLCQRDCERVLKLLSFRPRLPRPRFDPNDELPRRLSRADKDRLRWSAAIFLAIFAACLFWLVALHEMRMTEKARRGHHVEFDITRKVGEVMGQVFK